ncbi:MAG: MBL fold metallo-hydrolase [Bacteriovoracaceae bacterium]|nr:MBL fold metallo-hydrolase [Bacteriovoracaceae bacterium]
MVEIKQHYLACLAQASYTIISEDQAFVIDPRRDISEYTDELYDLKLSLAGVMVTHLHADFISGVKELADWGSAPLFAGKNAHVEYDHTAVSDGSSITFGRARIDFLETPGHTPGDISALLFDLDKSETDPVAIFTGDTLFNGAVGRPDLLASFGFDRRDLANMLYESLYNKILKLPNHVVVYPGHGEGSLCGKSLAEGTITTIGEQKKNNYALQAMNKEHFFYLIKDQPKAPKYFVMNATMNKQGVCALATTLDKVPALSLESFQQLINEEDVFILDTRDGSDFADGFIPNSVNVSLDGQFAVWAGILVDPDKKIVIVADESEEEESIIRLSRVGLENIVGYLDGGFDSWKQHGMLVDNYTRIRAKNAQKYIESSEVGAVIDLRNMSKISKEGRIKDALHVDLLEVSENLEHLVVDRKKKLLLFCSVGFQSPMAISMLRKMGHTNLVDIEGGMYAWKNAGGEII